MLIRTFSKCDLNVKRRLVQLFCTNFYACALWSTYTLDVMSRLKVAYNRVVRHFFGLEYTDSISQFLVENDLPVFSVLMRKYIFNFRSRVLTSNNGIVKCLINWCSFSDCSMNKEWTKRLYCF